MKELKKAIQKFEDLQFKYKHLGASDTEPDYQFQYTLANSLELYNNAHINYSSFDWNLFNGFDDVELAAQEMTDATNDIIDIIKSDRESYRDYLIDNILWRIKFV